MKQSYLFTTCLYVCFKGGMGTMVCLGSPLFLMNMSVFADHPQSREFPLHHHSGFGTRNVYDIISL